ncbi:putative repeat protein (TIGR01451 family) [Variovorax sp. 54]|nr:putative repeat protein (TIGR01451 family) [Variovorax sp. 54]
MATSTSFVIPVTPLLAAVPRVTNTAKASGGGDATCNGTGACASTVDTTVALPSIITATKTASANPLVVGAPDQFYTVAVNVSNATTAAPLSVADALPPGITLRGAPTLISRTTTGVLSGCPATGGSLADCSVAEGVAPGSFDLRIPVSVDASAVGVRGGTNTVNLSGGGDPACTAAAGQACDATTPDTPVVPMKLTLEKTASAASLVVGVPASYTLTLRSNGGATTKEAIVTDEVSPFLRIGTLPAGCTVVLQDVTCRVPAGTPLPVSFVIPVTPLASAVPRVTNIALATGGGDGTCNGVDACASSVNTPVTFPLAITSTKTASANPLLVGKTGQFYTVAVKVENLPTTAPLFIEDMLPTGITLAGPPTLLPGSTTGTLSGCPATGSLIANCSVAAGVVPGTLEIRIPIQVDGTAIGAQAGTNTVNLHGGGDSLCTALLGEPCDATTPATAVQAGDPRVRIIKEVVSGTGTHRFHFALSGLSAFSDTLTVTGAGRETGALNITGTVGVAATISETSPAGWPRNPIDAYCIDSKDIIAPSPIAPRPLRRAVGARAAGTPVVLTGNTLAIPADWMVPGADLLCTFVNNDAFVVSGRVFEDSGNGAGVPNDGLPNGGETGLAGVQMRLTNCAAGVLATAVTDGLGRYGLEVPTSTLRGDAMCVEEATPASHLSTGASVGSTRLPSGVAVDQGGKTYAYTRMADGAPDRVAFTWDDAPVGDLNFGDVALNRFGADSARGGPPGSSVSHAHTFVAQTGGAVSFGIANAVATPANTAWSAKIYADPGCTGALQAGAVVLYPPAVPTTVTAGQNLCVVMQELIPGNALAGHSDKSAVQASFVFTNASPGLNASYIVNDTTTVSTTALELKKEVRNATKNGTFGLNNEAKSGETLEYRITYTNNGATPISNLTLNDTTPVYTGFAGSQVDTTPTTLTACAKNTPANPVPAPSVACAVTQAAGGAGALDWKFTGQLVPGGTGAVLFRVTVN